MDPSSVEAPPARSARPAGEPPWLVPLLLALIAAFVLLSPWPLAAKLASVATAVSVNIPSHMLVFGPAGALPMSARNTGIYLGVAVAVALLLITGRGRANRFPPRAPLLLLAGFFVALVLDGFNSVLDTWHAGNPLYHPWYPPTNEVRVITGVFGGLAMALLIVSIANGLLWRHSPEPVADDMVDLAGYLVVCILIVLVVLRRPPLLYWPLALVSTAGVLLLASLVNLVPITLGLGRTRLARTWREALPLYLGALVFALCELAVAGAIQRLHG